MQLSCHFIDELWQNYDQYNETHLDFDRYDEAAVSLKASTRKRCLAGGNAIGYHITGTTAVGKLGMKQILSHSSTKDELNAYLAQEVLHHTADNGKCIVVAWRDKADASHREVNLGSSKGGLYKITTACCSHHK